MMTVARGVRGLASRVSSLPVLSRLSPAGDRTPESAELAGYLECQRLAEAGVREVASQLREGWTERQAADLLNTYLCDCGVRGFFHKAFVWFGERTRFRGVKTYWDYMPSRRAVLPGEVFILDVAPIHQGFICDVGYTASLGENPELDRAQTFLAELKDEIPRLFQSERSGGAVWERIDAAIRDAGYDNVHAMYPFSVLGHRVHRVRLPAPAVDFINFGVQSYWEFLSRGLFGQLLNGDYRGSLTGLWAVEPHIGTETFGAKFEEILVVDDDGARWLEPRPR